MKKLKLLLGIATVAVLAGCDDHSSSGKAETSQSNGAAPYGGLQRENGAEPPVGNLPREGNASGPAMKQETPVGPR